MKTLNKQGVLGNPLVLAALLGMLVWLADQPTVPGYNPLLAMFWDPGVRQLPVHDCVVLFFSWLATDAARCGAFRASRRRSRFFQFSAVLVMTVDILSISQA